MCYGFRAAVAAIPTSGDRSPPEFVARMNK